MNWKEYYKQHLMSAEDAVNHIQSGNRVVVAHACGEPSYLQYSALPMATMWTISTSL